MPGSYNYTRLRKMPVSGDNPLVVAASFAIAEAVIIVALAVALVCVIIVCL